MRYELLFVLPWSTKNGQFSHTLRGVSSQSTNETKERQSPDTDIRIVLVVHLIFVVVVLLILPLVTSDDRMTWNTRIDGIKELVRRQLSLQPPEKVR